MSLPCVTFLMQVHYHNLVYVTAMCHTSSTSTSPLCILRHHTVVYVSSMGYTSTNTLLYCTLRHWPGSPLFYKYITMLHTTSLPSGTVLLQVQHYIPHCFSLNVFYKCITILHSMSLPSFTIFRQVHNHILCHCHSWNLSYKCICILHSTPLPWVIILHTNISPYYILCHCFVSHFWCKTSFYCTLRHCPGSHIFYKHIAILHSMSLSCVTFLRGFITILHSTSLFVISLLQPGGSHFFYKYITTVQSTSPPWVTSVTSTSTWFILRRCTRSHFFAKYIIILYSTSQPWITLHLPAHHHTTLYIIASPNNILRCFRGSQLFYKYIVMQYCTSLFWFKLLNLHHHILLWIIALGHTFLQVHHTDLYATAMSHNTSANTSPCCTLRLHYATHYFQNITIFYSNSTLLGHTSSTGTPPYCILRDCPGSHLFYNYITIVGCTSLSLVPLPMQVHHHTVLYAVTLDEITLHLQVHSHTALYVTALGRTFSTSASPYCILRHFPGHTCHISTSSYCTIHHCLVSHFCPGPHPDKSITALHSASLFWVTLSQIHHHIFLLSHRSSSHSFYKSDLLISTSQPWIALRFRYITKLPSTSPLHYYQYIPIFCSN